MRFELQVCRTKDEEDLIIPNSRFVQDTVVHYTDADSLCRVWTPVAISYASDIDRVREVLESVCANIPSLSDRHAPLVQLIDFADSAVNYKVSVWIENPWDRGRVKSLLIEAIWRDLTEAGIMMPFPQLDVHFDAAAGIQPASGHALDAGKSIEDD